MEGLEPPRLAALEPKSSASTNFATPAGSITNNPKYQGLIDYTTHHNTHYIAFVNPQFQHAH